MSDRLRPDGSKIPGPNPVQDGRVRWPVHPRLQPAARDAITAEAARQDRSISYVVGRILEDWYADRLTAGVDDE